MRTVNLNDRLNDSLFYFFHSIEFFIQNTARLYWINGFKIVIFPLNIHHNGQCSLCMSAFFLRHLMRSRNSKVSSCPETDIVRHGPSCTSHKIRDALNAGQLHIIAVLIFLISIRKFCRCITCQKTFDHKLQESIFC